MCRSSGNLIQQRQSLFDNVPGYNIKNKPMLCYKFGSVYLVHVYIKLPDLVMHCEAYFFTQKIADIQVSKIPQGTMVNGL